jgi:hypothetical protein
VTNLFYWNNIVHDVAWFYGFDEASGNFQATNPSGLGLGNDAVNAQAQDYSGTNNANFSTPVDGAAPRMQMYVWGTALVNEVSFGGTTDVMSGAGFARARAAARSSPGPRSRASSPSSTAGPAPSPSRSRTPRTPARSARSSSTTPPATPARSAAPTRRS